MKETREQRWRHKYPPANLPSPAAQDKEEDILQDLEGDDLRSSGPRFELGSLYYE
jgi:hypothetical protein